jgi:hypothetical protein
LILFYVKEFLEKRLEIFKEMHNSLPHQELWGEFTTPKSGPSLSLSQQEREALGWMPKPLSLEGPRIHQPVGGEKSSGPTFASSKGTINYI